MVLEELNKSRVNIKDLAIKEPEGKGVPLFDPRKEIKEEQWTEMINDIGAAAWGSSGYLDQHSAVPFIETLKVAYPEKAQTVHETYVFSKYLVDRIEGTETAEEADNSTKLIWYTTIVNLRQLVHIEPEAITENNLNTFLSEDSWKRTLKELKRMRQRNSGDLFANFAFSSRIVFPQQFAALDIDKAFGKPWKDLSEDLEQIREDGKNWPERFMVLLGEQLAWMRVISPDRFSQRMILDSDWDSWKGLLRKLWEYRKSDRDNYQNFIDLVMSMSILGAKEVNITDHGLKLSGLILKGGFLPDLSPDLPQTRKF